MAERTHAWMNRCRRLALRHHIFQAFATLGYALGCLNQVRRFCQAILSDQEQDTPAEIAAHALACLPICPAAMRGAEAVPPHHSAHVSIKGARRSDRSGRRWRTWFASSWARAFPAASAHQAGCRQSKCGQVRPGAEVSAEPVWHRGTPTRVTPRCRRVGGSRRRASGCRGCPERRSWLPGVDQPAGALTLEMLPRWAYCRGRVGSARRCFGLAIRPWQPAVLRT